MTLDTSLRSYACLYIMSTASLDSKVCELQRQVICSLHTKYLVVEQGHISLNKHCIRKGGWEAQNNWYIGSLKLFQEHF